jgi:hypothetical protein
MKAFAYGLLRTIIGGLVGVMTLTFVLECLALPLVALNVFGPMLYTDSARIGCILGFPVGCLLWGKTLRPCKAAITGGATLTLILGAFEAAITYIGIRTSVLQPSQQSLVPKLVGHAVVVTCLCGAAGAASGYLTGCVLIWMKPLLPVARPLRKPVWHSYSHDRPPIQL